MDLSLAIYLVEIIGNLKYILVGIFLIGCICFIVAFMIYLASYDDNQENKICLKIIKKYTPFLIAIIFFAVFIPSKGSMYLMLGAKYLSNSELPAKVEKTLSLKIDDYIRELQKKNK